MIYTSEEWTRNVLEIVRRWEWMGRKDPSPAAFFTVKQIQYTVIVSGGDLCVSWRQKGSIVSRNLGPVDHACRQMRKTLSGNDAITPAAELRCSDCGALGYEWCPGCRSEVFPGRWGRDG